MAFWHALGWRRSSTRFCESAAQAPGSVFAAELVNTLSSLPLVAAGAFALHLALAERYGKRFVFIALAILLTGVGSVAFHASLLFAGQLLDELSMVATACAFLAALAVEPEAGAVGRRRRVAQRARNAWRRVAVPLAAALYVAAFGASYATVAREAYAFFVVSFAALVALCLWRARRNVLGADDAGGTLLRLLTAVAAVAPAALFLLWLPDRLLCAHVWPLHLHAAWHVLGAAMPLWLLAALVAELHVRRARLRLGLAVNLATGATAPAPAPLGEAAPKSAWAAAAAMSLAAAAVAAVGVATANAAGSSTAAAGAAAAADDDPEDEGLDVEDAAEAAAAGPLRAPRIEWMGCFVFRVPVVRLVRIVGEAR